MSKKTTQQMQELIERNRAELVFHEAVMNLACQIKISRKQNDLSQEALAALANMSPTTINRIEKGKINNFKIIMKVAQTLGIPIKITVGEEEKRNNWSPLETLMRWWRSLRDYF